MHDTSLDYLEEGTLQYKFLTFDLGDQSYGVETLQVSENVGIQANYCT